MPAKAIYLPRQVARDLYDDFTFMAVVAGFVLLYTWWAGVIFVALWIDTWLEWRSIWKINRRLAMARRLAKT